MRYTLFIILICMAASCQPDLPTDFSFLIGSWKMKTTDTSYIIETWEQIDAQHYHALNYVVTDSGGMQLSEEIALEVTDSGTYYKPTIEGINGDQPFLYKYILHEDNKYVFENKEYDFPRKIWYKLINAKHLEAGIENEQGDKKETFTFEKMEP